jgi:hypothetical protein
MEWRLNKEQIAEVVAMFTELCEKITDEEVSLNLNIRKNNAEEGKTLYTYDVHAIYKGKLIYINMGSYRSLMDSNITNIEAREIIDLLKGNK